MIEPKSGDNFSQSLDLSVVIVNWNVRELLCACLNSIDAGRGDLRLEVIVVDAGSSDGSPAMISSQFPWVRLIARRDNVGFPKGNNIGISAASGRYILLLNPDTEVIDDGLAKMASFLDTQPEVGIVGPQLLNVDGSVQSSRRRFPTLATAVFESTWLQPYAPKTLMHHYFADDLSDDATSDVDWLTGACLMVRHEVIEQVGLMDEAYFMYSEELDWCKRIKAAGWRVVYLPAAQLVHHVGASSQQAVTERHINFQRAKLRYFRKYHGRPAAVILRAILLMNYLWQLCLEGIKGLIGHKRALRRQRMQAYWQVLRSGLRPAGY